MLNLEIILNKSLETGLTAQCYLNEKIMFEKILLTYLSYDQQRHLSLRHRHCQQRLTIFDQKCFILDSSTQNDSLICKYACLTF